MFCIECNSDRHCDAMHEARNPTVVHSGEGDRVRPFGTTNAKITASCTQICGQEEFRGNMLIQSIIPINALRLTYLLMTKATDHWQNQSFLTTSMKIPRKSNMCFHHVLLVKSLLNQKYKFQTQSKNKKVHNRNSKTTS